MTFEALVGLALAGFGGFCAARMAGQAEVVNACCVGMVCVLIDLAVKTELPAWATSVTFILTIPAAYLGGLVAVWTRKSGTAEPADGDSASESTGESRE